MTTVRIVRLYPDLLGTYGDDGNAVVLAERARRRGHHADIVDVTSGRPVPDDGDVYVMGGGEDGPQVSAARQLSDSGALGRAVERGAAVLAVCAGFQLLGRTFVGADGADTEGVGLLDVTTFRGTGPRMVGEVAAEPRPGLDVPELSGYENHASATRVGSGAAPLARVLAGHGNGDGSGTEGAISGRVVATYLHGPVLARNPALADRLLAWALDVDSLPPLPDPAVDEAVAALRVERLRAAHAGGIRGGGVSGRRQPWRRRSRPA